MEIITVVKNNNNFSGGNSCVAGLQTLVEPL